MANAPIVARALHEYFSQKDTVSTETWASREYNSLQVDGSITIRLHGQLDTLIEKDAKVSVYDYKTREAMSVNSIKGNTKDSDGNYFRQLVFYKMLLEENFKYADAQIETSLVFVEPDSKGRCPIITLPIETDDEEKVKKEIDLLVKSVWSGVFLKTSCHETNCEWCKKKLENK